MTPNIITIIKDIVTQHLKSLPYHIQDGTLQGYIVIARNDDDTYITSIRVEGTLVTVYLGTMTTFDLQDPNSLPQFHNWLNTHFPKFHNWPK